MTPAPLSSLLAALAALAALPASTSALHVTDEEYARFPRLYHLDDYSSCLAKSEGLYCVGSFSVHPAAVHDPTYELMKEYSSDPFHFNRTQLHRGYCVSERCPASARAGRTTRRRRFEQCAAHWGRARHLRLTLTSFGYCRSHAQEYASRHNPEPYDLSQKLLLGVVALLVAANILGTSYDVLLGDGAKKSSLLAEWSVRSNWRRLTANYLDGDPRLNDLAPVQGIRVFLMLIIIGTHGGCIHDMLFLQNPRYVETVARHPVFMIFMNGTSVVMVFVLVSSFLLAYNLLLFSQRHALSASMLPLCVLKRLARISPVYLLVVGFAGTLWPALRSGPMWAGLVERESQVCRDKFWTHALFINNLVQPDDHCLVQTWFLATDMQLYIVAVLLTIWLSKKGLMALPILAALTTASCLLNGALAYHFEWKSLMYHVFPGTMHTMYKGVPSFYRMYTAPWGSLPASLVGLFLAHLHFEFQQRGIKPAQYTLFRAVYHVAPFLIVGWIVAGNWVREVTDPVFTASYVSLERPVLSILAAISALGLFNSVPGFWLNYFGWRGWHAMGRMSLSVLMVHWIINSCIAASRPQPISTSLLDVTVDSLATAALSYVVAIPLSLMVEMPVTRTINVLVFKPIELAHKLQAASRAKVPADIVKSTGEAVLTNSSKLKETTEVNTSDDLQDTTIQTVQLRVDTTNHVGLQEQPTSSTPEVTHSGILEAGEDSANDNDNCNTMDSNFGETAEEEPTISKSIEEQEEGVSEINQKDITHIDDALRLVDSICEHISLQDADIELHNAAADTEAVEAVEDTDDDVFSPETSADKDVKDEKVDGLFRTLVVVMRRTFKVI